MVDLAAMRAEYGSVGIGPGQMADEPFGQFDQWFNEAVDADLVEPNAMVLATVSKENVEPQPSSRIVLCKQVSEMGFDFFTNYQSRKSGELAGSGTVAATFPWIPLERQVNIVGTARRLTAADSDTYWGRRSRASQLGAWSSDQSDEIPSAEMLTKRYAHFDELYPEEVPRPDHWGGWRIQPSSVEFWQGRSNRLHDRMVYRRVKGDLWKLVRLSP